MPRVRVRVDVVWDGNVGGSISPYIKISSPCGGRVLGWKCGWVINPHIEISAPQGGNAVGWECWWVVKSI